jgi:hypothetical protein
MIVLPVVPVKMNALWKPSVRAMTNMSSMAVFVQIVAPVRISAPWRPSSPARIKRKNKFGLL